MQTLGSFELRRRLAGEIRELNENSILAGDETDFQAAIELISQANQLVSKNATEWRPRIDEREGNDKTAEDLFPFSPVIGSLSPISPPVKFYFKDGLVFGNMNLGVAYQGPPGCVHGGILAEFFDELLGAANIASGNGGLTGKLTVKYRSTTPLYKELRFEGRSYPPIGRKIRAQGWIWHEETLCCEAEGVFISVDYDKFRQITVERHL